MILIPFVGVGNIQFGSPLEEEIRKNSNLRFHKTTRSSDDEIEYILYMESNGEKVPFFSINEIKGEDGIQAVTLYTGPLYLNENREFDIFSIPNEEMQSLIGGNRISDSGGDIYLDYGMCPYFEYKEGNGPMKPSAVLLASRPYLDLLLA